MLSRQEFNASFHALRGIVALGDRATKLQQDQRLVLGKLLASTLSNPKSFPLATKQRIMYISEVRYLCPEAFAK